MWTSVPHIPVRGTRMRTSLMPIDGSGTSESQRPASARDLTRAFTGESYKKLVDLVAERTNSVRRLPRMWSKHLPGSDRFRFVFCHFRFQARHLAFWQPEEQFIPVHVLDDQGRFPPIVARNLDPFCADVL